MNLMRLLISPRDRHSNKPLKPPHSCRNIARLSFRSLILAGIFGSAVAADPEQNSNTTAAPITPPIAITEDGKFQLGDMDLGPFGVSPMEEFLEPPVDDPAAEQVEQVVLRNITNLRENLPKLIEQIRDIENNPELTDEGLVSLFSDFVELVNGSLPTHELVVESVETTRETLLDVHEKILALVTQFDQTSQLNGEALSSLENTLPLIFGGDGCDTDVAALIEGAVSGVAGSVLNIQRQQVRSRCGGDVDPELLRTQMLANPYASLSPQAQKQAQESAIVSRPSTSAVGGVPGLPGADGLLDGDNIDDLINGSSSSLTGFIQDLFAGEGLDLSNLNDTATALYDFTGRAGLPFAWVQIQDAVIPWVPGAVLPLVTQGPHGLELLLIRLQPVLRLTDNNQGNVIEAIANGSILLDTAIQVVIERPMANQLINFVQSHELIRNLQASAAGNLVADTLRQATPLGGLLDPVLDPIIGGNNNLARIFESAAEGNVSAIVELILRRFPTVLAAVPGGDIVPVSGEDIASLLGYDIEQAYSNGQGVCDPFPITATTYVQLDRSSTGSIFFARFDGALPRRIEANVGSNANFNVSFNNDLAVGASITLSPMCTQVPLDDDLKGLFGDLDLSLGTDLVGLYEEAVPPAADREPFVPDVNNPPDENDQFRMGPFSSAPTGDFLELSGGIMTNAFLLEEADARYARFALELPIEERFTLSVQAGVEDGEIFAQAGVDEGLYVALAAYTKNILSLFNLPIIDDTDERLLAVMQIFGLNSALRLEAGADSGGNDGLFADWQLIDPITEVNVAIPLFAGLRAQFGILNVPEFAAICAAPGPICPNNGYDSNHSDVLASARIELSEEAYPYFALLTREGGFVQGSFMTKFGTWLGFNFEQFFSRSNRVFLGFDTGGETIGGDASIVRCGTNADTPEDAANGLCANVVGFSIGGWIKGKVVELVDPINQETLIALVQQVVAAFEEIFSFLNDIILDFLNSVADLFEDIGSAIAQVGSLIGNAIGGFFGCLGDIVNAGSCIDRLGDRLQEQVAGS
ncbi:MAG: hypothetical protein OXT49_08130, partial [Gammaproteobacteria bacterium]|nr:hypothetical protein [Gammaproteobacteria bacterium]